MGNFTNAVGLWFHYVEDWQVPKRTLWQPLRKGPLGFRGRWPLYPAAFAFHNWKDVGAKGGPLKQIRLGIDLVLGLNKGSPVVWAPFGCMLGLLSTNSLVTKKFFGYNVQIAPVWFVRERSRPLGQGSSHL